jgi:surface carbohydrate biosynthesis protein
MLKKIILLPIESFKRDALSRVYLANKLCNSDFKFEVIIGHPEILLNVILPSVKNAIWLGRFISLTGDSKADKKLVLLMKRQNCRMFYLHDEGAFYADDNYDQALQMLHNPEFLNQEFVKYVFVWGEYQKEYLNKLIYRNKIIVSGMYRFDLLKSQITYNNINTKYGKSYTLINTRFPESNLLKGEVGIFDKRTLQHYLSSDINRENAIEDMFTVWSVINESFAVFIFAIYKLVSQNKESLFVIRPHPVESPKFYKEAFGFFENVIIDNNENVSDHIHYADIIIHNQCTTGVESIISGKPTINFVSTKRKNIVGTSNSGVSVSNYEELLYNYLLFKNDKFNNPIQNDNKYLININKDFLTYKVLIDILIKEQLDSVISIFDLYFNWNFSKLKTVVKFNLILPVYRMIKIKNKHLQYSTLELKKLNRFEKRNIINWNTIFSSLVLNKKK